ncbi:Ndufa13 family protein [Megaselia abdita]
MSTVAGDLAKKQDLPPPGGYKKIPFARIPQKSYMSGFQMFAAYITATGIGMGVYYLTAKEIRQEQIEMRSARNVIQPILLAERDREFLKQLSRNRKEEEDLMKNVEGWKVGTWYGEPIYKTEPEDKLITPILKEFYVHASYDDYYNASTLKLWS